MLKEALPEGVPFLLMCLRGNLYLQVAMPEPELERVQAWCACWNSGARAHRIRAALVRP